LRVRRYPRYRNIGAHRERASARHLSYTRLFFHIIPRQTVVVLRSPIARHAHTPPPQHLSLAGQFYPRVLAPAMEPADADVVIVGAGVAGLTAAAELLAGGLSPDRLVVLEAGARYGGRVHTVANGDDAYELGATWLHGSNRNPLYDWAAERGLLAGARAYMTDGSDGGDAPSDDTSAPKPWPACVPKRVDEGLNGHDHCGHDGELVLRPGGRVVSGAVTGEVMRAVAGALQRAATRVGERGLSPSVTVLPGVWAEYEAWAAARRLPPFLAGALWEIRHTDENLYTGGDSLASCSLTGYGAYDMMDGVNTPPPGGFATVVHALARPAVGAGVLRYGKRVTRVADTRSSNGDDGRAAAAVVVTCDDGSSVAAPVVILTVSLGVLKAWTAPQAPLLPPPPHPHPPVFTPPLPPRKVGAIARLGFGRVEKVHLLYDAFWWRQLWVRVAPPPASLPPPSLGVQRERELADGAAEGCFGFAFAWDRALVRAAAADDGSSDGSSSSDSIGVGAGAVPAAPAAATAATGASSLVTPPSPPFPGYRPWMARVYGAFEDADPRPPTVPRLTFWLYGDAADAVDPPPAAAAATANAPGGGGGGLTDDELAEGMTAILRHFLLPQDSNDSAAGADDGDDDAPFLLGRLPRGAVDVPPPLSLHRSRWGSDPLFRGSYAYIATGSTVDDIHALAEPVLLPPPSAGSSGAALLFAGEATHPAYYSATHSAFATGRREAARALSLLRERRGAAAAAVECTNA
jgi:spermine oxidase